MNFTEKFSFLFGILIFKISFTFITLLSCIYLDQFRKSYGQFITNFHKIMFRIHFFLNLLYTFVTYTRTYGVNCISISKRLKKSLMKFL